MLLEAEKIIKIGNIAVITKGQQTYVENLKSLVNKEEEEEQIVIFNIGKGEYGFNINYVKEIIRLPDTTKAPNTLSHIEGVMSIRNQVLALINLVKLLGIDCKEPDEYSRVIIIDNGSFSFGIIVDRVSHVISVDKKLFKNSKDISKDSYIKGIYNLNKGNKLIMMLEPKKLISLEEAKDISEFKQKKALKDKSLYVEEEDNSFEHIVVFKLGTEEYGIEINNVQEINRMSDITHFPGAPKFISGMVNLRGNIIPILNLRTLLLFKIQ